MMIFDSVLVYVLYGIAAFVGVIAIYIMGKTQAHENSGMKDNLDHKDGTRVYIIL